MADLVITEADVTSANDTQTYRTYQVAEAITAGMPVSQDADGKLIKAIADTEDNADIIGIALTAATGANEYIVVAERGSIVTGATMEIGRFYVVSETAGGLAPFDDLTTGAFVTYVFVAETATVARLAIDVTDVQVA